MVCLARQHSDQMVCGKCALQWDINDPEPPACRNAEKVVEPLKPEIHVQEILQFLDGDLK